jgi:hypothetical protein
VQRWIRLHAIRFGQHDARFSLNVDAEARCESSKRQRGVLHQRCRAFGNNMGFSTTWVALFVLGASALVGTFGKKLVRIIGLAVMPFAFAGLILSLSHNGSAPSQAPVINDASNNQSGGTNILNITGPESLLFDPTIGDQLARKLPTGKSIEVVAVGSRTDWNTADQYAQYLKARGFDVTFSRSSEVVPPPDRKITIRDDPTTSPIIVIIAPSAL